MRRVLRAAGLAAALGLSALAAAHPPGQAPLERTLFRDLPANDPVREIVRTVLDSRFFSMRDGFPPREWAAGGYGAAWDRTRRYFPDRAFYVAPGTYFMTHGFDADGRLFMEVHASAYLDLCVENRRTFAPETVFEAYGRMREAADDRQEEGFKDKLGRLEPFFRDAAALGGLQKALGDDLYLGLLKSLREEDYHMIAGGLMHEGLHGGLDDALVARLQAEFNAGHRPVQWDELRAFMAEIGYHARYVRWAESDVAGHWGTVEGSLAGLENLRRKPRPDPGSGRMKLERVRARAWASAALLRLRMREIWQSARRGRDLAEGFRRDYVGAGPPSDVEGLLTALEGDTAAFVDAAGEAIQATELAVRSLEELLDVWGEWVDGRRPFPPPVTDSRAIIKQVGGIVWPAPAVDPAEALMRKADEALEKERRPA